MSERVLVCGGRHFADYEVVKEMLDFVHDSVGVSVVIHGGARGADSLADRWAYENEVERIVYHADWEGKGKKAGPLRNERMLKQGKPDRLIAFPGGRGTADMLRRARGRVRIIQTREGHPTP